MTDTYERKFAVKIRLCLKDIGIFKSNFAAPRLLLCVFKMLLQLLLVHSLNSTWIIKNQNIFASSRKITLLESYQIYETHFLRFIDSIGENIFLESISPTVQWGKVQLAFAMWFMNLDEITSYFLQLYTVCSFYHMFPMVGLD